MKINKLQQLLSQCPVIITSPFLDSLIQGIRINANSLIFLFQQLGSLITYLFRLSHGNGQKMTNQSFFNVLPSKRHKYVSSAIKKLLVWKTNEQNSVGSVRTPANFHSILPIQFPLVWHQKLLSTIMSFVIPLKY